MSKANRLNIAFLSVNDPLDKRSWSGTTYYIGNTLQRNVGDVHFLGPVHFPRWIDKTLRAVAKINRLLFKKEYATKYSLLLSWYASRALQKKMRGNRYDCIVAPAASTELSYLKTAIPVVFISDTTFHLISNYYHREFRDMLPFSKWEGNHIEARALKNSAHAIFSSDWAAVSAQKDYGVQPGKISVMPLGANMDFSPDAAVVTKKYENKTLTLLYLAVEWERKGGAIALEALEALQASGVDAKLIVCGCTPPEGVAHPAMKVIPFLNKNIPADHNRFIELLSTVHFLILPTRADCSLLVACESNAYGVPAITTNTGGVPNIVLDGVNGYCLPYEAGGKEYANCIKAIYSDPERYHALVLSSRKRYEEHLNWDKWAEGFLQIYHTRLQPAKA